MKLSDAMICADCEELFQSGDTMGNTCPKCAGVGTHPIHLWLNPEQRNKWKIRHHAEHYGLPLTRSVERRLTQQLKD